MEKINSNSNFSKILQHSYMYKKKYETYKQDTLHVKCYKAI